jgi:hypothetical protein
MNYKYKLQEEDDDGYSRVEVIEFLEEEYINTWTLNILSQNFKNKDFFSIKDFESFQRTKKWLKNNHSELLP